jgi:hypothetical protein
MSSIVLGADTLLNTTPTIGSVEFDGKAFYATAQGTQRGIIPGAQYYRLDANLSGSNVTTAQNILGVSVTLSTSTVYGFEAFYMLNKVAGATAHTVGFGFGGSATTNNISYMAVGFDGTSAIPVRSSTSDMTVSNSAANLAFTGSIASATSIVMATIKGTVSINGGGTFTPQYTLSAAPGNSYSTLTGSYFLIYPIGASGAVTSVGAWA